MTTRERLARLLGVLFRVRPAELPPVLVLFAWCFCLVGAVWLTRAVRDSLFLANVSAARLPYMYVASPLSISAVGFGYARIADAFRRERLVVVTALLVAGALVAARAALGSGVWIYYVLYVGADVAASLAAVQLWTVAADRFTARDAKRLFGLIAAGGTLATIVIGFGVSGLVRRAGAENLLYACAGLFLATGGLALVLARMVGGRLGRPGRRRPGSRDARGLDAPGAGHLRRVALIVMCAVVTVTLIDFEFKSITAAALHGDRVAMVRFFGLVGGAAGTVALAIQLGVTARLLARLGVAGALAILPVLLGLGAAGLLIVPGLATATFCKASDATLRYTLNDAGMQLVYLPVPSQVRSRVKAFIDAVVRPGTEAMVGLGLLCARAFTVALAPLAGVAVVTAAAWTIAVARLRPAYVRSLRETLRRRRLDFERLAPGVRELAALVPAAPAAVPLAAPADLVERLGEGPRVARALAAAGPGSEPALAAVLADAAARPARRHNAARALGLLATPEAVAVLLDALPAAGEALRDALCQAVARAHRRNPALPVARRALLDACDRDLRAAFRSLAAAEGLGRPQAAKRADGARAPLPFRPADPEGAAALISRTLRERSERARDRVFDLLAALHPELRLDEIKRNLGDADPARRANAVEVLDSVLDRRLRRTLVPLVDETPRYLKLRAVQPLLHVPRRARDEWLAELLGDASPWMVSCAAYYAGANAIAALADRLAALRAHDSAMVRESAERALARLGLAEAAC